MLGEEGNSLVSKRPPHVTHQGWDARAADESWRPPGLARAAFPCNRALCSRPRESPHGSTGVLTGHRREGDRDGDSATKRLRLGLSGGELSTERAHRQSDRTCSARGEAGRKAFRAEGGGCGLPGAPPGFTPPLTPVRSLLWAHLFSLPRPQPTSSCVPGYLSQRSGEPS